MSVALGAEPADIDAVTALVRSAGTSFYRGMRVLPPDRRAAMYAIYGFCRIVDDIADEPGTLESKRAALDGWRARIAAVYRGVADDSVTGRQTVTFTSVAGGVEVTLGLTYQLRRTTPVTVVIDLLFIRRQMTMSLTRTLSRFGAHLRSGRTPR